MPALDAMTAGAAGDLGNVMKGAGLNGNMVNSGLVGRSGATKELLVKAGGGNAESEAAVARGLNWLAKQQKANGSWVFDGSSRVETSVATGMALLRFVVDPSPSWPAPFSPTAQSVASLVR